MKKIKGEEPSFFDFEHFIWRKQNRNQRKEIGHDISAYLVQSARGVKKNLQKKIQEKFQEFKLQYSYIYTLDTIIIRMYKFMKTTILWKKFWNKRISSIKDWMQVDYSQNAITVIFFGCDVFDMYVSLVAEICPFPCDFLSRAAHPQQPRHPLQKHWPHLKKTSDSKDGKNKSGWYVIQS